MSFYSELYCFTTNPVIYIILIICICIIACMCLFKYIDYIRYLYIYKNLLEMKAIK